MAGDNSDILKEFAEFLDAKRQADKDEQSSEDFEVEIWDEKGRGVRTRRSHAKPFLQQLGLDPDTLDETDSDESDDSKGNAKKTDKKGPRQTSTKSQSVARKYFTKTQG